MASDQAFRAPSGQTLTALSRWSILDKKLPPVDKISTVHVYDFDNTLFKTPLPNPKLWNGSTISQLSSPDIFVNGGWWHDSRILAATGEGVEQEEKRAWDGWWNEKVVELVQLSMKQSDALCVLLTGRSEQGFAQLIKRIVRSKGLEFDMIGLKPAVGPNNERISNTMSFKQSFIKALMGTYRAATEIRIYEDRPHHVNGFREFLVEYNKERVALRQEAIDSEVIQVAELSTTLDPVVEVAEVQHMINIHNNLVKDQVGNGRNSRRMVIKKTVFFTSYMLEPADTKRLVLLLNDLAPDVTDLKYLANTILITPRPCPKSILDKIGGMNAKMKWEVVDIGTFHGNVWAARVRPVPADAPYHTDNPYPSVVLGLRKGARPPDVNKIRNWRPIPTEKCFVFETTVGEKMMLRIDRDEQDDDDQQERSSQTNFKRKFQTDEDRHLRQHNGNSGGNNREYHTSAYQGRGGADNRGRGGFRGNGNSRGNRGGGRGGFKGSGRGGKGIHGYRSLDDVDVREGSQGGFGPSAVSYDDSFIPPPPQSTNQHQQPLPPPPLYGHPFPQPGQWPAPGSAPNSTQGRPAGGPGPDLQNFY
ncbi:hypothetical protein F5Y04DRAFT_280898 [Hypomontagnella monticulosa]|nr:hypothetical protein F5Y04DRAFT_280898 [Hypomontagnella monticulosa]